MKIDFSFQHNDENFERVFSAIARNRKLDELRNVIQEGGTSCIDNFIITYDPEVGVLGITLATIHRSQGIRFNFELCPDDYQRLYDILDMKLESIT